MSQPTEEPPAPTSDHTQWVWIDGQWVDQEKPEPVPVEIPPRPDDTDTETWELSHGGWVKVPLPPELLAERAAEAEQRAARVAVRSIITDLQVEKTRADAVIAKTNATITGGDTKDVARGVKRIADAVIDLVRFLQP